MSTVTIDPDDWEQVVRLADLIEDRCGVRGIDAVALGGALHEFAYDDPFAEVASLVDSLAARLAAIREATR